MDLPTTNWNIVLVGMRKKMHSVFYFVEEKRKMKGNREKWFVLLNSHSKLMLLKVVGSK